MNEADYGPDQDAEILIEEDDASAEAHQQELEQRQQLEWSVRLTFDQWAAITLAVSNHIDELLRHANERPGGFWAERLRYAQDARDALDRMVRA